MLNEKQDKLKAAVTNAEGIVVNSKAELAKLEAVAEPDKDAVKAAKAEVKKAEAAVKKATVALSKQQAADIKKAEAETKKAEVEAAKVAKAEKAAAKVKEREDAKLAKAAEREANRMPEQNGVRRPRPKTLCGQVWDMADALSTKLGQPTPVKELLEKATAKGLNEGNVKAEYARWRKFHGVTGRVSLPKAEVKEDAKA